MSVIIFFAVLFVLILVHEWGHYIVAKKSDMQVDEFGIGFPPKVFGIKKGETEYTFNLLPIGGFVRILGENAEDIAEGDEGASDRSFVSKSKWAQAAVLIAGVTMNVLFAWLLFATVFFIGVPTAVDESSAGPDAELVIAGLLPEGPAALAGLPVGARVLMVSDGTTDVKNLTADRFREFVGERAGIPVTVTYSLGKAEATVTFTPESGLIPDDDTAGAAGVMVTLVETERLPIHLAVYEGLLMTGRSLGAITVGLGSLLAGIFTGGADLSAVAGPVGIAGMVGDAAAIGVTSLLMFTAVISLNLAVINLLPFPALDGGRLVFVAIEAVTRRPINPVWVGRLNMIGFGLLILLMLVVTYNDIVRLL